MLLPHCHYFDAAAPLLYFACCRHAFTLQTTERHAMPMPRWLITPLVFDDARLFDFRHLMPAFR